MFKGSKKGSIVISLGDDGAIVTCFEGNGELKNRYFVSGPFSTEFEDLVKNNPSHSIYLILDTIDQNYVFSNFPALRSGNLMKMVNRKIQNEFDPEDINSYICLGKDESSARKDLKYVFVSIRRASPLVDWLEVIKGLNNKFEGIFTYPIESEDFIKPISKAFPHELNEGNKSSWKILISHNRVGGFRQVVYKDGRIIFTRISQANNIQSPDSVGVNISQEAANTLEYIRRVGFDDDTLLIYVICAKEASQFIEIPGVEEEDIIQISPYDISKKMKLESAAQENDKFGDVIFAANFLKSKKKKLKIVVNEFKKINQLLMVKSLLSKTLKAIIFILPFLVLFSLYSIYENFGKIDEQDSLSRNYKKQISTIKDFEDQYGVNPDFVVNMVGLHEKIVKNDSVLFNLMSRYTKASDNLSVAETVSYKEDGESFTLSLTLKLVTDGIQDYADLIIRSQEFSGAIKGEFAEDYQDIVFSNMPSEDNIKFDSVGNQDVSNANINLVIKGQVK